MSYKYWRRRINGKLIDNHRYVMEQHLGRKLKPSELVHHIDGDPTNDDINNLRLTTRSKHAKEHMGKVEIERFKAEGVKRSKPVLQFDLNKNFIKRHSSIREANRSIGVKDKSCHIIDVCKKRPKNKTAYGFIWRYESEMLAEGFEPSKTYVTES